MFVEVSSQVLTYGWSRGRVKTVPLESLEQVVIVNRDTWHISLRTREGQRLDVPLYLDTDEAKEFADALRGRSVNVRMGAE